MSSLTLARLFARAQDVTALLGRIAIALVFLVHGLQRWEDGVPATAHSFDLMGVPLATVAAVFTIAVEVIGSLAYIAGLALPAVGVCYAVIGLGALFTAHAGNGIAGPGGYGLVLVLALAGLALGFHGGRFSVDHAISSFRQARREEREPAEQM